jgi:hypothetical protein
MLFVVLFSTEVHCLCLAKYSDLKTRLSRKGKNIRGNRRDKVTVYIEEAAKIKAFIEMHSFLCNFLQLGINHRHQYFAARWRT